MPKQWLSFSEAELLVGSGKAEEIIAGCRADEIRSRCRTTGGGIHELRTSDWYGKVDCENSRIQYNDVVSYSMSSKRLTLKHHAAFEIDRETLLKYFHEDGQSSSDVARTKDKIERHAGGRPREWNWDYFWIELFAHIWNNGLPAPGEQAELERVMLSWFAEHNEGKQPADSEVRKRVGKLVRHFRAVGN